MAQIDETQTEAIFRHHLDSILTKDVDAVLEGFAEDAVVFTPDGPIRGHEKIREDSIEFSKLVTTEFLDSFKVGRLDFSGDIVFFTWSAGTRFPLATETFVIRDGKIVVQTFSACDR